jgi:hypothetical protein
MDASPKRRTNETKFERWQELSHGGRRYWLDVPGLHGWMARYVKEVDTAEQTIRFYQEIFDGNGRLVEIHEKYPVDRGHAKVEGKP